MSLITLFINAITWTSNDKITKTILNTHLPFSRRTARMRFKSRDNKRVCYRQVQQHFITKPLIYQMIYKHITQTARTADKTVVLNFYTIIVPQLRVIICI